MPELVTHIKSWTHNNGDIVLHGSPVGLEIATASRIPHGVVFVLLVKRKRIRTNARKIETVYYLQQRAQSKALYPGLKTVGASGRIQHGETVMQAARREAKEELGIELKKPFLLTSLPLILNPDKPFHYIFPVIAEAKSRPHPNVSEVNPEGSKYYRAHELVSELASGRLTPSAKNFFETLGQVRSSKLRR